MINFSKIPKEKKGTEVVAIGMFAVFCSSLRKASAVVEQLHKKRGDIPACGYATVNREKVYWCRYGFLNDNTIYA
jgi:hypothetical protein